jgi:hypothetical protein
MYIVRGILDFFLRPSTSSEIGMPHLFGDDANAVRASIGKTITCIELSHLPTLDLALELHITFTDGSQLVLWDDRQECCENRYMTCDDQGAFPYHVGATLVSIEIASVEEQGANDNSDAQHDIQFLNVQTSVGLIQCCSHNEHNGYYSGFAIAAELVDPVNPFFPGEGYV